MFPGILRMLGIISTIRVIALTKQIKIATLYNSYSSRKEKVNQYFTISILTKCEDDDKK